MTYAILRYRLLDIELLAKDTMIYGTTLGFLVAPFVVSSAIWHGSVISPALLAGAVVSSTLFYRRLYPYVGQWLDLLIFTGRFSGKRTIQAARQQVFRLSNLKDLIDATLARAQDDLQAERIALYFHSMTTNQYLCMGGKDAGKHYAAELPSYSEDDRLISQLRGGNLARLEAEQEAGFDLVLPLCQETGLFGFILVSKSQAGAAEMERIRTSLEQPLGYAYVFYEQSVMLNKMTHDNIRYAGNIRRFAMLALRTSLSDMQKKWLGIIDKDASLLEGYLNDLRQIMAILARRMQGQYKLEPYDLEDVVRQILPMERTHAEQKGIRFTCNVPEEASNSGRPALIGLGERSSVKHVIENLLSNAFKFTQAGGTVSLEVKNLGKQLQIVVADTGSGIPQSSLSHIFDLFYQGEGRSEMEQSTGLGLSIVKEIVALHSGNVDVISEVGKGTSFYVVLPTCANIEATAA